MAAMHTVGDQNYVLIAVDNAVLWKCACSVHGTYVCVFIDQVLLWLVTQVEYEEVARSDLDDLFDLWGSASAILDDFLFEQMQAGEGLTM